jgi:hypothetical protein
MDKNKRLEQTETGAADRGDLVKRKMFKHMLRREFSDIPGGYGLPIKEAEEKVKKLERRAQAETGAADRRMKKAADRMGGMAKMMKSEKASKMGKVATAKPKMGSASKRADGVAKKGKTKGKMMAGGGMAKMMAAGGKTKMMRSGGMSKMMKSGGKV